MLPQKFITSKVIGMNSFFQIPYFGKERMLITLSAKSHSLKLSSTLNDCRKSICSANNIIVHLVGSAALLLCHRPNSGLIYSSITPLTSVQTAPLALPRRL